MGAVTYSVGEVAEVLGVSKKTILRRIESGELGARKRNRVWRISSGDLKNWVLRAIGRRDASKTCTNSENIGINSDKSTGQPAPLNWLVYQTEDGIYRPLTGTHELALPADAAVKLQGKFSWFASRMTPRDPHMQDDLVQEMSLAAARGRSAGRRTIWRTSGCGE